MHYMLNAYHESLEFELPHLNSSPGWKRWIDTSLESPHDISTINEAVAITTEQYTVQSHSIIILFSMMEQDLG